MGIHDGHRERMRERFLQHGLLTFNEYEALELLLYYAIPQKDTNPLSHALLDHFGSLDAVLHASEQELCEVSGVGERTAALMMLVPQLCRLSEIQKVRKHDRLDSVEDCIRYLRPYYQGLKDEKLMMVCLDSTMKVISTEVLSTGVVSGLTFDTRQLMEVALKRKSSFVLLAHNHPDGQAYPSREDDNTTMRLFHALEVMGISLLDHIIFAGEKEHSYRRSGSMDLFSYY